MGETGDLIPGAHITVNVNIVYGFHLCISLFAGTKAYQPDQDGHAGNN
jgi:hypothetical protein